MCYLSHLSHVIYCLCLLKWPVNSNDLSLSGGIMESLSKESSNFQVIGFVRSPRNANLCSVCSNLCRALINLHLWLRSSSCSLSSVLALSQLSLCLSKITEHWAFFVGQTGHSLKHFVLFLIRLWFIKVEIFIILSLAVWSSFLHIPGSWALSRGQELNVICNWAVAGAGAGQGK